MNGEAMHLANVSPIPVFAGRSTMWESSRCILFKLWPVPREAIHLPPGEPGGDCWTAGLLDVCICILQLRQLHHRIYRSQRSGVQIMADHEIQSELCENSHISRRRGLPFQKLQWYGKHQRRQGCIYQQFKILYQLVQLRWCGYQLGISL